MPIELYCSKREKDQTVAAVLKARLDLSWGKVKKLIEGRHVKIGGQVEANPARRVRPGLRIEVASNVVEKKFTGEDRPPPAKKNAPAPKPTSRNSKQPVQKSKTDRSDSRPGSSVSKQASRNSNLVYSDDTIVVVNKPAGLTTMRHAEEAAEFGKGKRFLPKTLADLLPEMLDEPGRKVIAVHRIDRDTSGLVVFARNARAEKHLTDQFRKHTADRRYLALVRGKPKAGRIESKFIEDRGDGRRGSGESPDAKKAVTNVKVVEKLGAFAAVECRLETGRTHQVRIHLGESGTPLCGERIYDRPINGKPYPDGSGAERPMLHAARLGFVHPVTGESMVWDVPPPADFAALWAELRSNNRSDGDE
ncbi:MAG: RluA family pseudouridine synthase [Gemmataceae bacterium]